MNISIPKEIQPGETRVALSPEAVSTFAKEGLNIFIEQSAGENSYFSDDAYSKAGATIVKDKKKLFQDADIILKVQKPTEKEISLMKPDTVLISFLWALFDDDLVKQLLKAQITALGLDAVPRISRAQKMDALSSMSSISGYKAVLIGANSIGKYIPMMMTAAGTIPPAKSLVLGAGVAGLQAIATLRRLGAVVEAFDVRPAVKEQVESLGARFVDVPLEEEDTETSGGYAKELSEKSQQRQKETIHKHASQADIIITTALIPGKPAPKLIDSSTVEAMSFGSVIVDLAAEQGGNCELSEPGKTVVKKGVTIHAPLNVPALLPLHASHLYAKNIGALLSHIIKDGALHLDFEDEITLNTTITHKGKIISPMLKEN